MTDLKRSTNFLDLPPELADPASAAAYIIPAPFDATSSWHKGADLGPQAIINASAALEWHDAETARAPADLGIHTTPPVTAAPDADPIAYAAAVRHAVASALDDHRFPVLLGGEHSVSTGAINAAADHHPDLTVVQLDAHADLRNTYKGSTHSHACVMARARERAHILQIGIRSVSDEERSLLDPERTIFAHHINADPDHAWIDRAIDIAAPGPVYLTIDLDAFDPALLPATGTPEPNGLNWAHATSLIDRLADHASIVALDLVELCPRPHLHAAEFFAAKLVNRALAAVLHTRS